jgi:tetratricopeptide (TPR) repeat protein
MMHAHPRSTARSSGRSGRPFALITLLLFALVVPITTGCRPKTRTEVFDRGAAADYAARLERWLSKHPDDHRARLELAHVYWLHLAAPDQATTHLDRLTARATPSPLARFSRGLLAQSHLDIDRAWAEHAALLREAPKYEKRRDRELALALTPQAARALDAFDGMRFGDAEEFVALYESLDLSAYPGEAVEQLISTRAGIARRLGEDYRPFYARQGCVQDWVVGELEGYRGPLELSRLEIDRSFTADPEGAQPTQLSCAFRVWNTEPRSAIRRLRTTVELPEGQSVMRLSVGTQYDARVYVDDQLVWARDRTDRYPVQGPNFLLPVGTGLHRVEVRTAIPSERAWVLVRATDPSGNPLAVRADREHEGSWRLPADPTRPREIGAEDMLEIHPWADVPHSLRGPVYAPLIPFLALDDALADGDTDRAEILADELRFEAESFPEAHLLLADFEYRDPSRGKTSSAARQQASLERALELDPSLGRARLSLLSLRLDRGEVAEVVEELEAIPTDVFSGTGKLLMSMLRFDAYRRRGSDFQAEQALERAAAINPQSCDVLMARRELIRERAQVAAEDQITAELARCPGSIGIRARLAVQRQRYDEAAALWQERLDRIPDDLDAMDALAEIAVARGDYDEAIAWHERMLELAPYRALSQVELADLHARADEPRAAREYLLAALDRYPHNSRLREIGERVGIPDELMQWRIDGMQALAEYRGDVEEGLASDGVSEVLLLDREVSMLYENGGHRHIVHQMFHILSDQAIDAHGEFSQPGVELLTMHSIKPDGTIVEPESIPGKEGLSLRGLAIGDVVEIEFVFDTGPEPALPGHVDLGRFRFQSPEIPFHRSELLVVYPASLESKLKIEARNDPPAPTRRELSLREGKFVELTFLARQVPRLGSEPGARSMLDELPMIQAHVPFEVEDWLDQLAAQLRPAQRSNPALRQIALELTGEYTSSYDKIDALWRWVVDEIEDGGDLSTPATVTLSARQGSRLMLLRALAEAAGIDTQLWLLRDRFGPQIQAGGDPLVGTYDTAMLAVVEEGKAPLMVGTSSEVVPLGYLSPSYAGGRALRLRLHDDEPEPGYVEVPENPARLGDLRRWDIEIALDNRGGGRVHGTIELRGLEAIMWRDVFDKVDADRLPEVFTQAELSRMLPGASLDLEQLEFDNKWELDQPLVIHFAARARNGGVVQGRQLILLAAAVPIDPLTGFAQLPTRWSGMVINYATVLEAKVRYVLDGATFTEVPPDVRLEGPWGSYARTLGAGGVGQRELVLESRSTVVPGIVEPKDYSDLAALAGRIQSAEQQLLRAR